MLNGRLYRTAWLIAGVGLVVALLTLQTPDSGPEPDLPSSIDGAGTLALVSQFRGVAPERPAGSAADLQAARFVQGQLAQVPGAVPPGGRKSRVVVQEFQARRGRETVDLQNVYLVVPGVRGGAARGGIVVVAPRDTPEGVASGASSTAILLRLARASGTTRHQRPHLFVSTDGSTIGNAGMRWFLERFRAFPLAGAIVLDAPGEADGDRVHVWTAGRDERQALDLGHIAGRAVERAGGRPTPPPSLGGQLLRLGVPQTFGEQGAAIAAGLPAVTLAGRAESPLREDAAPTAERLELTANAANDLLGALDAVASVPEADGSLAFADRTLRPLVVRLAFLLLLLPVLVVAIDILARARRAGAPLAAGLRAAALRTVPLLIALLAAHLLSRTRLLPPLAAGTPPLPADARFDVAGGFALALALAAGILAGRALGRRRGRLGVSAAAEGTAAIGILAVVLVVLWLVHPYALVLALPAAHAGLLALAVRRGRQLAALGALALAPLVFLAGHIAGILNANPLFAAWYLAATSVAGARGAIVLIGLFVITGCLWSITLLVLARARAGGVLAGPPAARTRRPRRPGPPARGRPRR